MTRSHQLLLNLPLRPNYSADDYINSPCNWEASQWVERWPDWPVKMIAISGEPGCGKTHLAHIWQQKTGARFLTPSDIPTLSPHAALDGASAIVLDDADFLFLQMSKSHTIALNEAWMFHFYNIIQEKGLDLLLCSRQPPTLWNVSLPDLRSRLSTILSVPVNPPDEEVLKAVLFKLCSERGMTLSVDVGDYILRRVERSFDRIRSLVTTLDHHTLSQHRQLTLGLVREILQDS